MIAKRSCATFRGGSQNYTVVTASGTTHCIVYSGPGTVLPVCHCLFIFHRSIHTRLFTQANHTIWQLAATFNKVAGVDQFTAAHCCVPHIALH